MSLLLWPVPVQNLSSLRGGHCGPYSFCRLLRNIDVLNGRIGKLRRKLELTPGFLRLRN